LNGCAGSTRHLSRGLPRETGFAFCGAARFQSYRKIADQIRRAAAGQKP
jgi:hypothetical protein